MDMINDARQTTVTDNEGQKRSFGGVVVLGFDFDDLLKLRLIEVFSSVF
jgi:hypothetical protein